MANPQHYSWASKHLPFSFGLQMHHGQFGSAVPLQRPHFVTVSAGCCLVTSALLKEPHTSLSWNTAYPSSVPGHLTAWLCLWPWGQEDSYAHRLHGLFLQRIPPGSLVHSALLPAVPGERAQVGKLPRVAFLFQLVFTEIEVLHWQFFRLSSAWLGACPTSKMDLIF